MKISVQKPAPSINLPGDHASVQKTDGGFSVTVPDDRGVHNLIESGDTIMTVDGDAALNGVMLPVTRTTPDDARVATVGATLAASDAGAQTSISLPGSN